MTAPRTPRRTPPGPRPAHSTHEPGRTLRTVSDRDLVAAIVDGDDDALAELMVLHHRYLWQIAYRHVGREHVAHDVLAAVLDIVWRKAGSFRGDSLVTTWLFRITANTALSVLRSERARPDLPLATAPSGEALSLHQVTGRRDVAADVADRDLVAHLLAELPAHHRRAVELVDLAGYSIAEAAAALGCAEGTVKSRRARAFHTLAARWTPDGDRRRQDTR